MIRRAVATIHACALLCIVALAQTRQSAPAESPGPYRIAGVLVNAATGEPLSRATIAALRDEDAREVASCTTDNEGRFALDGLAAAKYELSATKRGFRGAYYDQHDEYSTAIVTGPDQDPTHLLFKLTPGAILRGTVTSDDGDPVAGARIMLFKKPKHPGMGQRMEQSGTSVADDTGAYELAGLAPGAYLLAVIAEPWYAVHEGSPARRNTALDVAYPVTYFDSTTEEASATPIALSGGSREEANISLHAVPALHLTVAVPRNPNGVVTQPTTLEQNVFGTIISSQGASFSDPARTSTVEISGIAPGQYQLTQGDPPRVVSLDLSASQQVDLNEGTAANAVTGRLQMWSGATPPDEVTVSLERIDNGPGQFIYPANARQGQFKFDAVPPGEWALAATSGSRIFPVVSVSAGATRQAGNILTLRDRAPELTVTISDFETDVKGFAKKDGKGVSGAMIVLLPRNQAQWRALTRRDQSDSDGSFVMHNVVPGEYTLVAIVDGWELDWTSPEVMARYLPGGSNVRVSESSGKLVQLSAPVAVEER
jgi:hypothetical protein